MYRWLPTHTRYTCYDSLEVAEVSQGPVTSLPSHSPRPPLKSRLSGCHLPIDFLAALFSGGGGLGRGFALRDRPRFLSGCPRVTPRRFRATSRTGDVVVSVGRGGNGCVNTRLVTRAYVVLRAFVVERVSFLSSVLNEIRFYEKR